MFYKRIFVMIAETEKIEKFQKYDEMSDQGEGGG